MQAGAKTAYLIDKPMAAAIGARVSVATTDGILVVNLGAGSTDVAAIAQGEMLAMDSIRTGGDALDRAIEIALSNRHGWQLRAGEAERLKLVIGSATAPARESWLEVAVVDQKETNGPLRVSSTEVQQAIQAPLDTIAASLQQLLGQLPEGRRISLNRNGAVLTGGGAQLRGIAEYLAGRAGIPVRVARDPQSCVAVGTGMALDNLQVIRRGQHYIT
jgi:rod shape-determining protein MreB